MINYNKRNLTLISIIIAIILSISINLILMQSKEKPEKEINSSLILKTSIINPVNNENEVVEMAINQYKSNNTWKIEIPAIELDAPILEGTTKEVMRKAVGHFKETNTWEGNVCLAAHNRGYKYNYFKDINKLNIGDYIKYTNKQGTKLYKITTNEIIKETDLSYIKKTKDNRITLITCVENMPEYRQCIQAIEAI